MNKSFLSIVNKGGPSGKTLLVRARQAGDIQQVFPDAEVQIGAESDYRYRARIDREQLANAIADAIRNMIIVISNRQSQIRIAMMLRIR
ncbi:hypothetical protein [Methylobacter marinus]|uniref:hypothetical protein n=1 Tax=Methylobacter marinus TaxID=34058 RepID=UPI001E5E215F|nr:hypothetical protein [Methylobacter marinus]